MLGPANPSAVEKNASHAPIADTAAVVTLVAIANEYHVIDSIHVGFDQAPAAPEDIDVTFGGFLKFRHTIAADVTAAGPHEFVFPRGLYTRTPNEEVVVSLGADSTGALGKVNVTYR